MTFALGFIAGVVVTLCIVAITLGRAAKGLATACLDGLFR